MSCSKIIDLNVTHVDVFVFSPSIVLYRFPDSSQGESSRPRQHEDASSPADEQEGQWTRWSFHQMFLSPVDVENVQFHPELLLSIVPKSISTGEIEMKIDAERSIDLLRFRIQNQICSFLVPSQIHRVHRIEEEIL